MGSMCCVSGSNSTWPTAEMRHWLHICLSLKLSKPQRKHRQKQRGGMAALPSGILQMEGRGSRAGGAHTFPFAAVLGGGGRVQGTFPFPRGGEPAVGAGAVGHAVHAVGGGGECAVEGGGNVGGRFSMKALAGGIALERFEYFPAAIIRSSS